MIPIILLVCVSGVGVFGLVGAIAMLKRGYVKRRDARVRAQARALLIEAARANTSRTPAPAPAPIPSAAPVHIAPVNDLSGVIAKLEQSARFAKAPAETIPRPMRAAKGSVAPPMAQVAPPMAQVAPPAQVAPRAKRTMPPPIPSAALRSRRT